jgi:hypothetical protein
MDGTNAPMVEVAQPFDSVLRLSPLITGKVFLSLVRDTVKYAFSLKTTMCKKVGGIFGSVHHTNTENTEKSFLR